jgi:hypothetical protein
MEEVTMKGWIKKGFLLGLVLAFGIGAGMPSEAMAGGTISGQVIDGDGSLAPLEGITVYFHDSENAEVVASALTDSNGLYNSGDLPAGDYKLRFRDLQGGYFTEYYGAGGADVFDLGTVVSVGDGTTSTVDEDMVIINVIVPVAEFYVTGHVTDVQDATPLEGIEVRFLDAVSAQFIGATTTDASGFYYLDLTIFGGSAVKVRFFDPLGTYLSEFLGAGGADSFDLGSLLTEDSRDIDETMVRLTPSDAVQDLIGMTTDPALVAPLDQASKLLGDSNPNNDMGSCGVMNGFINQVNAKERKGELSATEAEELRSAAETVKSLLGCL